MLPVLFLLAAVTITAASMYGQVASGALDGSRSRGKYLAESTARSCAELAMADVLDLKSAGRSIASPFRYGTEFFPDSRGRKFSCTAAISTGATGVTITATAQATTPKEVQEAVVTKFFGNSK